MSIIIASDWLFLSVLLCAFAWMAGRKLAAITLPAAVALAAFAVYLPLGKPIPLAPKPGSYTVVGADIVPNVGIWVLLKEGSNPPVYYRLPYSNSQADQLQNAMDGEGGVKATVGDEGGVRYEGDPPQSDDAPAKQPEVPALSIP